jgi:hypothetical protein
VPCLAPLESSQLVASQPKHDCLLGPDDDATKTRVPVNDGEEGHQHDPHNCLGQKRAASKRDDGTVSNKVLKSSVDM